jgi:integrase
MQRHDSKNGENAKDGKSKKSRDARQRRKASIVSSSTGRDVRPRAAAAPCNALIEKMIRKGGRQRAEWATIRRRFRGDPIRQIKEWWQGLPQPACTGRERLAAFETARTRESQLARIVREMIEIGFQIQNLEEITQRHVRAVVARWERQGDQSASTMKGKLGALRQFMIAIGRPMVVPLLEDMLHDKSLGQRSSVLDTGKSVEAQQIDPERIFEEAERRIGRIFAHQLRLMYLLGFRDAEVVCLRPAIAYRGNICVISFATKGGRARVLVLHAEEQHVALELAATLAAGNPDGYLGEPGVPLHIALRRFRDAAAAIGLSRDGLGVTAYAFRHSFFCNKYEVLSGVPAPVMGGPELPPENKRLIDQVLAEDTGHHRISTHAAYGSTSARQKQLRTTRRGARVSAFQHQGLRSILADAGISYLAILGDEALGAQPGNVVLFAWQGHQITHERDVPDLVRQSVTAAMGGRVCLFVHCSDPQAQDKALLQLYP